MGHAEDRLPELSVLRILVFLRLVDRAVFERATAFLHPLNKALAAFFSGRQLLCFFWIRTFRHFSSSINPFESALIRGPYTLIKAPSSSNSVGSPFGQDRKSVV